MTTTRPDLAVTVERPDLAAVVEALALKLAATDALADGEAVDAYIELSDEVRLIIVERRARDAWTRNVDVDAESHIDHVRLEPFTEADGTLIGWHAVGFDEDAVALYVANVLAESLTVDDCDTAAR